MDILVLTKDMKRQYISILFFRRDELCRLQTYTNVSLKNWADGGGRELLHPGTISLLIVSRWDFSQLQLFPDEVAVTCGVK